MLVGSPLYMPLETLQKNIYTEKNDVWSMGIMLFEMLTGDFPFKGKTSKDLITQINFTPIKRLIPKRISAEVTEILECLLEKDYKERISFKKLYKLLFPEQKKSENRLSI